MHSYVLYSRLSVAIECHESKYILRVMWLYCCFLAHSGVLLCPHACVFARKDFMVCERQTVYPPLTKNHCKRRFPPPPAPWSFRCTGKMKCWQGKRINAFLANRADERLFPLGR